MIRRTPIKKLSKKGKVKKEEKKKLLLQDFAFYSSLWEERDHYCYECGKGIPEPLTLNFHHLLPKRNFPEFRHTSENIVILCPDCHQQVESNIDKCPRTKELTETVKECLLNN